MITISSLSLNLELHSGLKPEKVQCVKVQQDVVI